MLTVFWDAHTDASMHALTNKTKKQYAFGHTTLGGGINNTNNNAV